MTDLVFEISTSVSGRFLLVIETAIAGLLRDCGLAEEEGKLLAHEVCEGLPEALRSQDGGRLGCVVRYSGKEVMLEVSSDSSCDLSGMAEKVERIVERSACVTAAEFGDGDSRLVLRLSLNSGDGKGGC